MQERILILGAAGRDFHHFNVAYRGNEAVHVVGFTAAQIPDIDDRRYPPELAGPGYPDGIPIHPEADLETLISDLHVDRVVFAYSDVPHEHVMHLAARSVASGAALEIPATPLIESTLPVVAVTAVRTGAGKSPTSRAVRRILTGRGLRVGVIRHPMPYGDLVKQRVQRFATYEDLAAHNATIEEREEYELHIAEGSVVYAGVDYAEILRLAEEENDVILWDGGNNDLPFYRPDLHICIADPHRPGHGMSYWPGEANLRRADIVIVSKVDTAEPEGIARVLETVAAINPTAIVIQAGLEITLSDPAAVVGKRVLVIEDGPTLTHGGMAYGAGTVAAHDHGAAELIDPRPFAVGSIRDVFERYPHMGALLPAMGYGDSQIEELQATIAAAQADVILVGTPADIGRLIELPAPSIRVSYEYVDRSSLTLEETLAGLG